MATQQIIDQYITYDARLASFHRGSKNGSSSASGRAKVAAWPHKQIAPASLAKAGFYFHPTSSSPDNVACFLCGKSLDGWEIGDDPLREHLKHAPECGWAIVAAIEAEIEDYPLQDPRAPKMVEARHATFAGKWPYEGKKGWKCKTKQLVEAGWKYTPTPESDDMATCAYCQLALDGWEPIDKPHDEHYSRSPGCAFFLLFNRHEGAKKTTRSKTARSSKASRLSTQSVATASSDATAAADTTVTRDDSVLTTASTMSHGGRKPKTKKAATTRASRTKTTKTSCAEAYTVEEQEPKIRAHTQPIKVPRGKKRGSSAVDDASVLVTDVPATKRRPMRARSSTLTTSTTIVADDSSMADAHGSTLLGASIKASRQPSALSTISNASVASLRVPTSQLLNDEEIERQLEEDLAREWDDEDDDNAALCNIHHGATGIDKAAVAQTAADYAMFDPSATHVEDAAVDEELRALQSEMEVDEPEEALHVPKKTRKTAKAATRKVSKQTKPKKKSNQWPSIVEEHRRGYDGAGPSIESGENELSHADPKNGDEAPTRARARPHKISTAIRRSAPANEPSQPPTNGGCGRPPKTSTAHQACTDTADRVESAAPAKAARQTTSNNDCNERPSKELSPTSQGSNRDDDYPTKGGRARWSRNSGQSAEQKLAGDAQGQSHDVNLVPEPEEEAQPALQEPTPPVRPPTEQAASSSGNSAAQHVAGKSNTPSHAISPTPSARQPALSPSQSPQSSDAENRHPSLRSSAPVCAAGERIALVPATATATPMCGSPTKRTVLVGLESSAPWTSTCLDAVLGSPVAGAADKDNLVGRLLRMGDELTSPEKAMTVEEWIYFNAGEAERKLKYECEAMIGRFEREGTRAMRALEGLAVE